jgi:hypothetical protein
VNPPPRHPYFDDRAAVEWQRSLDEALPIARASGLRVLVVITGAECGGSRALLERVFPKEEITEELRRGFVCVYADVRSLSPSVSALLAAAPKREPTPVCLYVAPEDSGPRLLLSTAGGRPPAVFIRDLTDAHARR